MRLEWEQARFRKKGIKTLFDKYSSYQDITCYAFTICVLNRWNMGPFHHEIDASFASPTVCVKYFYYLCIWNMSPWYHTCPYITWYMHVPCICSTWSVEGQGQAKCAGINNKITSRIAEEHSKSQYCSTPAGPWDVHSLSHKVWGPYPCAL